MTKRKDPDRNQRGGRRPNAGRKPSVPGGRAQLTINLARRTIEALGIYPARVAEEIVERFVADGGRKHGIEPD